MADTDDQSAYEGRTDNPSPDTDAARRGRAAGTGPATPPAAQPETVTHDERAREGGGAPQERD
jgi:hypothetical protein